MNAPEDDPRDENMDWEGYEEWLDGLPVVQPNEIEVVEVLPLMDDAEPPF